MPSPWDEEEALHRAAAPGTGSIIVILATDAPLLPHQCERLAQRAGLGIARVGGARRAFERRHLPRLLHREPRQAQGDEVRTDPAPFEVSDAFPTAAISDLFWGAIEATEEAILNALVAAETMMGRDDITAHALDHERLTAIMTEAGRGPR